MLTDSAEEEAIIIFGKEHLGRVVQPTLVSRSPVVVMNTSAKLLSTNVK